MKIKWSPDAKRDIVRLYKFIREANEHAADKALELIYDEAGLLGRHPEVGRMHDMDKSIRIWMFQFGKSGYVMYYKIYADHILISRIWHGREDH